MVLKAWQAVTVVGLGAPISQGGKFAESPRSGHTGVSRDFIANPIIIYCLEFIRLFLMLALVIGHAVSVARTARIPV